MSAAIVATIPITAVYAGRRKLNQVDPTIIVAQAVKSAVAHVLGINTNQVHNSGVQSTSSLLASKFSIRLNAHSIT